MAATGKTPILLYGSTTATNAPVAGNLTNSSDGCEIAINVADKNLFFKDSTNAVNTVPIRQSSASSNGWLSSTDWSTFNGKQAALVSGSNIKTVNGTTLLGSGDLGTINVGYGGTGLTSVTAGYIPFGSTASALSSDAALFWNNTNKTLGIGLVNGTSKLEVAGTGANNAGSYATYEGTIKINESGGSSLATTGGLEFKCSVFGSGYGAKIYATDAGTLLFGTRANSATWTQTMQISNAGGVSIGNTTDPGATNLSVNGQVLVGTATALGNGLTVAKASGTSATLYSKNTNNTSGDINSIFAIGANANDTSSFYLVCTQPGVRDALYIYGNGNVVNVNNSYGTLSDIKLKENIVDATPKLNDFLKLKVRNFNLKSNPELKQIGFVAQEMQQIFPALVEETPDKDENGNLTGEVTLGIKTTVLIPMLVKVLQEQNEIVNALEKRIATLEGK